MTGLESDFLHGENYREMHLQLCVTLSGEDKGAKLKNGTASSKIV